MITDSFFSHCIHTSMNVARDVEFPAGIEFSALHLPSSNTSEFVLGGELCKNHAHIKEVMTTKDEHIDFEEPPKTVRSITGVRIEVENVSFSKTVKAHCLAKEKTIQILNGLSVTFMEGEVTAVMGCSGSKTFFF